MPVSTCNHPCLMTSMRLNYNRWNDDGPVVEEEDNIGWSGASVCISFRSRERQCVNETKYNRYGCHQKHLLPRYHRSRSFQQTLKDVPSRTYYRLNSLLDLSFGWPQKKKVAQTGFFSGLIILEVIKKGDVVYLNLLLFFFSSNWSKMREFGHIPSLAILRSHRQANMMQDTARKHHKRWKSAHIWFFCITRDKHFTAIRTSIIFWDDWRGFWHSLS